MFCGDKSAAKNLIFVKSELFHFFFFISSDQNISLQRQEKPSSLSFSICFKPNKSYKFQLVGAYW